MRKVFLEELPRNKGGKQINWKQSVGYRVRFIYEDVEGSVEIKDYIKKKNTELIIQYNNKELAITIGNFAKCQLGNLLDKITKDFKVEIGTRFQDEKRNITIIDREYRKDEKGYDEKWYKYHCNICTWDEGWLSEEHLTSRNIGCACCRGFKVVQGINDIPTTNPELIKYFVGGYDEAKLYTYSSGKSIYPICPECRNIKSKKRTILNIYKYHSISCEYCSDSISYPEKFMFNILEQLGLEFQTQLTKTTLKWCKKYKYDFYFKVNEESYIIETHGMQHYEKSNRGRSLEEEQENDKLKKELALTNGIKDENYIIIDCRYSNLKWIKQNILESQLDKLFNLSEITWLKAEEFSTCSRVKEVSDMWKNGIESTKEIANNTKLSIPTVTKYLHIGTQLKWCSYDSKKQRKVPNNKKSKKIVEVFKNGISQGIFESATEIEKKSEELFGIQLSASCVGKVCRKKIKQHKGFTFRYIENKVKESHNKELVQAS